MFAKLCLIQLFEKSFAYPQAPGHFSAFVYVFYCKINGDFFERIHINTVY